MRKTIHISSSSREELVDITKQVERVVQQATVQDGVACLYAQGATATIMIQENWDDSIRGDMVDHQAASSSP